MSIVKPSDVIPRAKSWLRGAVRSEHAPAYGFFAVLLLCGLAALYSGGFAVLEEQVAAPLEFHTRQALNLAPAVDARLRIFSLDDDSYAALHIPALSSKYWAGIIAALAKVKPRAIVTTHMFGTGEFDAAGELAAAIDQARSTGVQVVAGSFAYPGPISFRDPLPPRSVLSPTGADWDQLALPTRLGWRLYGPSPIDAAHFSRLGHLGYDNDGEAALFLRLAPGLIVPHLGLAIAGSVQLRGSDLQVDQGQVSLANQGRTPINFVPPAAFAARMKSLKALLKDVDAGQPARYVEPGDIVLLLMDMYTGKVNFVSTPHGLYPAGYPVASLLNSTLTGQWLRQVPLGAGAVVLALAAGCLVVLLPEGWWVACLLGLAPLLLIGGGLAAFAAAGYSLPWLPVVVLYSASALGQYLLRVRLRLAHARAREVATERETARLGAIVRTTQMFAHDVRKPFSIVAMAQKLLALEQDPQRLKPLLDRLGPELQRAMTAVEAMIRDIMEIDGQTKLFIETADLRKSLRESYQTVTAARSEEAVAVRWRLGHTAPLAVDIARLQRVFVNILENALQAKSREGTLWIETDDAVEQGVAGVRICLGNSGSLIPADKLAEVFTAFYTSGKRHGTGLGLAIAHKIVAAHGGRIWARSSLQKGTEFLLLLPARRVESAPRAPSAEPLPEAPSADAPQALSAEYAPSASEILAVIDDNVFIAESWQMIATDARVLVFTSPQDFFARLEAEPTLLLALAAVVTDFDFGSPAYDGLALARQLHAMAPNLKIFLSSDAEVQPGSGDGVTACIAKEPVLLRTLLAIKAPGARRLSVA